MSYNRFLILTIAAAGCAMDPELGDELTTEDYLDSDQEAVAFEDDSEAELQDLGLDEANLEEQDARASELDADELADQLEAASEAGISPSELVDQPLTPRAGTTRCIKFEAQYLDAGFGEDYWTASTPWLRPLFGWRVEWYTSGGTRVTGVDENLGDGRGSGDPGAGCTSGLPTGLLYAVVYPEAKVNGYDLSFELDGFANTGPFPTAILSPGDVYTITPTSSREKGAVNAFVAATYSLWRLGGGQSNKSIHFNMTASGGSSGTADGLDGYNITIQNSNDHTELKFLIAHEIGHAIYWFGTSGKLDGVQDSSYRHVAMPTDPTDSRYCEHPERDDDFSWLPKRSGAPMNAREFPSAAFHEGFAHFYAAAVWNRRSDGNCKFKHYPNYYGNFPAGFPAADQMTARPTINCRSGEGLWEQPFMDTYCPLSPGSTKTDYSSAIDWMRTLWYVYVENTDGYVVGDILDWIEGSVDSYGPWQRDESCNASENHLSVANTLLFEACYNSGWSWCSAVMGAMIENGVWHTDCN